MKRLLFPALLGLVVVSPALQSGRQYELPSLWAQVQDRKLNESSGVAPSQEYPGEYLTHNDSGDTARFFRVNKEGEITAEFKLKGVQARDWEEMGSATIGVKNMVYIGDIGDNPSKNESVKIYRFEEPRGSSGEISVFDTFTVTYPGGARNAEAMLIDPKTGDIWVVQKSSGPGGIYRLRNPKRSGKYKFEYMGKIEFPDGLAPMRVITGGAVSPSGSHVVLRTYAFAYEFPIPGREMKSWLTTKATRIQTPLEMQGEAICYSADGRSIITTSEGTPCRISSIQIK